MSQNGENVMLTFEILESLRRIDVASFSVLFATRFLSFRVRLFVVSSKLYEIVPSSSVVAFIANNPVVFRERIFVIRTESSFTFISFSVPRRMVSLRTFRRYVSTAFLSYIYVFRLTFPVSLTSSILSPTFAPPEIFTAPLEKVYTSSIGRTA